MRITSYVRQIVLYLVVTILGIVFVAPAGQFFISLAEEHGWYPDPSAKLRAVIAFFGAFAAIAGSPWFHWVGGAIIGFAGGIWLDVILSREGEAMAMAIGKDNIPISVTPSHAPLTFDENHFRLELRKFASSLDDAYKKLTRVFGDLLQMDHDKNPDAHQNERFFASNSIGDLQ